MKIVGIRTSINVGRWEADVDQGRRTGWKQRINLGGPLLRRFSTFGGL